MIKTFIDNRAASRYCRDNNVPYSHLKGNTVSLPIIGGVVTLPSDNKIPTRDVRVSAFYGKLHMHTQGVNRNV